MGQLTDIDKVVTDFIYQHPDRVADYLKQAGYTLPKPLTLPIITAKTFKAIYEDNNMKFKELLGQGIDNSEYNNWIVAAIGIVVSVAGMALSSKSASKARDLQEKIALAQLSQDRLLAEEALRVQSETARTEILLTTLEKYRSNLQIQSTQRLKDVWIIAATLAAGVSLIWATKELVKTF